MVRYGAGNEMGWHCMLRSGMVRERRWRGIGRYGQVWPDLVW